MRWLVYVSLEIGPMTFNVSDTLTSLRQLRTCSIVSMCRGFNASLHSTAAGGWFATNTSLSVHRWCEVGRHITVPTKFIYMFFEVISHNLRTLKEKV